MSKITLNDLTDLQNENSAVTKINNNNTLIEDAIENTLSRDGTSPNSMNAVLDMNSYRIINLPEPTSDTEPVTKAWADEHYAPESSGYADDAAASAAAAAASAAAALVSENNAETSETNAGTSETNAAASAQLADDWANKTSGTVDGSEYSAKKYAQDAASLVGAVAIPATAVYSTTGIGQFSLTPTPAVTSVAEGDRFRFKVPTGLSRDGAYKALIDGVTTAGFIRTPDNSEYMRWDDFVQGEYMTIRALAAGGTTWAPEGPLMSRMQTWFPHGTAKLQTSSSNQLHLTQEDGRGMILYSQSLGRFVNYPISSISNTNIFAAQNYVGGVANQAYAANRLYNIYLFDNAGTPTLDAYVAYATGPAGEGWTPVTNDIGIYVKPTTIGGSTPDNTRVFVGTLWTAGNDVTVNLSGGTITLPCQSHFKMWRFPFHSDVNTVSGFTSATYSTQTSPTCLFVNEGITDTGQVRLHANYTNSSAGALGSMRINVTGTAHNGTSFSATSNEAKVSCPAAGYTSNMMCEWGVAIPRGVFTLRPEIKVSTGTATFELWMTGYIAE